MRFYFEVCLVVVVSVCCLKGAFGQYEILDYDALTQAGKPETSSSTCTWEDPPENGFSYKPCPTGICKDRKGAVQAEGTIRFTRCKEHFGLVKGRDQDKCQKGSWTSKGHTCVPCGRSLKKFDTDEERPLIHFGYNASLGEFPWIAALYTPLDGGRWEQICGGTLISPRVVLTAAHCFFLGANELKPEHIHVGLGRISSDYNVDEPSSIVIPVRKIIKPERYSGLDHQYDLDIGLLVLAQSVNINSYVMPACIDWTARTPPRHNEIGLIAGYGVTEKEPKVRSPVLKWAFQKYIDFENCRKMTPPTEKKFITQDKFCVQEVHDAKADKGDSGGPLTFLRNNFHYIYGIVSTKMNAGNTYHLRLFTNVLNDLHLAWLKRHWQAIHTQDEVEIDRNGGQCVVGPKVPEKTETASYEQDVRDICKEENGNKWICKHLGECPKAVEAARHKKKIPICNLKGKHKDNPVVCCEPYMKQPRPESVGKKMCRWFANSVFTVVPKPGTDDYSLTDNCPMEPLLPGRWKDVKLGEFPHLAIVSFNNFRSWCYGSLISEKYIIASATCTLYYEDSIKARLGLRQTSSEGLSQQEQAQIREFDVVSIVRHPDFDYRYTYHSIALLKLKTSVRFSQYIRPVCLHTAHVFPEEYVTFIGERDNVFIQENTTIITRKECNAAFPDTTEVNKGVLDESMICARFIRNEGEVEIYGGMPLQVRLNEPYCMYSLVGISSFDQGSLYRLNGYMRVSHYYPWIESVVWPK